MLGGCYVFFIFISPSVPRSAVKMSANQLIQIKGLIHAISALPSGKSMGTDNLASQHLKHAWDMLPHLLPILSLVCSYIVICLLI